MGNTERQKKKKSKMGVRHMEIKALQCMKLIIDVRFPGESYAH